MNASELATKMLEWEQKKNELDELETAIKSAVLEIGKTQNTGNVRASYSAGRKSYDYETPAYGVAPDEVVQAHTKTTVVISWRDVCKEVGIDPIVTGQSAPSVTVKLV